MTEWWTNQDAGLIGGLGGAVIGILGGVIGVLGARCVPQGKCKTLVMGMVAFMGGFGAIALVTGLTAVFMCQPYHVHYPMLMLGAICTILGFTMYRIMSKRYREAEHRRFEAEQIRRA